jgi:hypothetical protein
LDTSFPFGHIRYYLKADPLFDPKLDVTKVKKQPIELPSNKIVAIVPPTDNFKFDLEVEKDVYSSGDIIKGKIAFENTLKKDIDKVEVEIDGTESVVVTENEQPIQSVEQYKYPINGNWRAGDSKID